MFNIVVSSNSLQSLATTLYAPERLICSEQTTKWEKNINNYGLINCSLMINHCN